MVNVEGVSQQWCDQFGARVLAKLTSCYNNYPDLLLDNFLNKQFVLKETGPVSYSVCVILCIIIRLGDGANAKRNY